MTESFFPGPETARALRDAFGRFATGVTVVTAATPGGAVGITANSFASVSLDPPLLLWCPAKASQRHAAFVAAGRFALHVMGTDQDAIIAGFARHADAFDRCTLRHADDGLPLIEGCPARFECRTRQRIDAGDHTVLIGEVERVSVEPGREPRLFLGGRYGGFVAR